MRRRVYSVFMLAVVMFLCVVAALAWYQDRSGTVARAGAAFVTVPLGETVTMEDGTTVTVRDPRVGTTPDGEYLYSYGVDFCAGSGDVKPGDGNGNGDGAGTGGAPEETAAVPPGSSGSSEPWGRKVSWRRFLLRYGEDLDWTAAVAPDIDLGGEPLADTSVPAGQCTAGRIGFLIKEKIDDTVIVMIDDVVGEVRWQEG